MKINYRILIQELINNHDWFLLRNKWQLWQESSKISEKAIKITVFTVIEKSLQISWGVNVQNGLFESMVSGAHNEVMPNKTIHESIKRIWLKRFRLYNSDITS